MWLETEELADAESGIGWLLLVEKAVLTFTGRNFLFELELVLSAHKIR